MVRPRILVALVALLPAAGCNEVLGFGGFVVQEDDAGVSRVDAAVPEDAGTDAGGTSLDGCVLTTYFADDDGDGYGDPLDTLKACLRPTGYVDRGGDCDDALRGVHVDAEETCDGFDDDCDDAIDEGVFAFAGASTNITSDRASGFVSVLATSVGYVVPWLRADDRAVLTFVRPDGTVLMDALPGDGVNADENPRAAVVSIAAGERVVVTWRASGMARARVYDNAGAPIGSAFSLGTLAGPQNVVEVVPAGERALALWYSAQELRARLLDPGAGVALGTEMIAAFSDTGGWELGIGADTVGYLSVTMPTAIASADGSEAVVGFLGQVAPMINATAYFVRLTLDTSPVLRDGRVPVAPYLSTYHATTVGPIEADRAYTLLWNGDVETCLASVTFPAPFDLPDPAEAPVVGACTPVSGTARSGARRGSLLTLAVVDARERLGLLDVAIDGTSASGGELVVMTDDTNVPVSGVQSGSLALDAAGGRGMAVYTTGTTPPNALHTRPIGCE